LVVFRKTGRGMPLPEIVHESLTARRRMTSLFDDPDCADQIILESYNYVRPATVQYSKADSQNHPTRLSKSVSRGDRRRRPAWDLC
jgi:hypothetical protein